MNASPNDNIPSYLNRHQHKELLRFLACGSVDDGKSTLIGRLLHDSKGIYEDQLAAVKRDSIKHGTTGVGEVDLPLVTDGLRAEREQGITIDVAYRYFSTDQRKFIIADTPGHDQYTRNMATGASHCDLAIILIDARHGIMPQTRRHSYIVSLLGIRHIVVAINKMDLVGFSHGSFEAIQKEYLSFVAKLGIPDVKVIPISALKGDNVVEKSCNMPWFSGQPLLTHLETVQIASDRNLTELRFPVQWVLRPDANFRGYSGTIASGTIRQGDEVTVLPSRRTSRVKSIVTFNDELVEAVAPQAVTLTLEDEIDISRGDMLVHAQNEPHLSNEIEAMMIWMGEKPMTIAKDYWLKQTTRMVGCQCGEIRYAVDVNTLEKRSTSELAMNEVGCARFALTRPLAFDAYNKNRATGAFILIDRLTNNTVGAGMILEPEQDRLENERFATDDNRITSDEREQRIRQRGGAILIFGRNSSSLAHTIERRLFDLGLIVSMIPAMEDSGRAIEIAGVLSNSGILSICHFDCSTEEFRRRAKDSIGRDRCVEVPDADKLGDQDGLEGLLREVQEKFRIRVL